MHLLQLTFVVSSLLSFTSAALTPAEATISLETKLQNDADAGLISRDVLAKRACDDKSGCKCAKGTKQGQYCGLCDQVTDKGDSPYWTGYSFECNKSGGCCAYGKTTHCASSTYSNWCPRG